MKTRIQVGLSAALLLGCSPLALAQAQHAGHVVSEPAPVRVRAVASGGAAAPQVTSVRGTSSHMTTTAAAAGNGFFGAGGAGLTMPGVFNPLNPFPGFGFGNSPFGGSFSNDFGVRSLIDPVTELRVAAAERFFRNSRFAGAPGVFFLDGGGAYAYPAGPAGPDTGDQGAAPAAGPAQPQVVIVQAPGGQAGQPTNAGAEEAPQEPLPDVGEFTLVLRNGVEISAIAFTRVNDRIIYITPAGGRRTIAASDLDSEATERTNQERGTPLQLTL